MASPERDPVEAAFEAKIAAWTAALESYRAAKSLDAPVGDLSVGLAGGGRGMDLPVGVFRDKSLKEAIPLYLQVGRRKQTNKEIAEGLKAGGFHTTAENFEATVATALYRLKTDGVILRFPDGWDVASSYPDSLRSRLEKDAKPAKKVGRNKVKGGVRTQTRKAEARSRSKPKAVVRPPVAAKAPAQSPGLEERIVTYLRTRGSEFTTVQELAIQLKVENVQVLRLALGKMVKQQKIEKSDDGRFRLVKKAA